MVIDATAAEVLPLQPLIDTIQPLMVKLSLFAGGLIALYIIFILIRLYYEYKVVRLLKDIRYDLDQLNMHHGISYSKVGRGFLRRAFWSIFGSSKGKKISGKKK